MLQAYTSKALAFTQPIKGRGVGARMELYEKFGTRSQQYKDNQKLLNQLSDPANKVVGRALCQVCEQTFGHSGRVKHVFTCNGCFEEIEHERFFLGRLTRSI